MTRLLYAVFAASSASETGCGTAYLSMVRMVHDRAYFPLGHHKDLHRTQPKPFPSTMLVHQDMSFSPRIQKNTDEKDGL